MWRFVLDMHSSDNVSSIIFLVIFAIVGVIGACFLVDVMSKEDGRVVYTDGDTAIIYIKNGAECEYVVSYDNNWENDWVCRLYK